MKFTTYLGLYSRTTRLYETGTHVDNHSISHRTGFSPSVMPLSKGLLPIASSVILLHKTTILKHNKALPILNLSSSLFTRRY